MLPLRIDLLNDWGQMVTLLLETVGNWGEIGTVLTHEMFNIQELKYLTRHDVALEEILGEPLPPAAHPWNDYRGSDRILLPTKRTSLQEGEDLKLRLLVLSQAPPETVSLYWRPLGEGEYARVPFTHVARGVYEITLPAEMVHNDFEYYVEAMIGETPLRVPPTAPRRNQTVVVSESPPTKPEASNVNRPKQSS